MGYGAVLNRVWTSSRTAAEYHEFIMGIIELGEIPEWPKHRRARSLYLDSSMLSWLLVCRMHDPMESSTPSRSRSVVDATPTRSTLHLHARHMRNAMYSCRDRHKGGCRCQRVQ